MREAAYIKLFLVLFEVLSANGEYFVSEEIRALNTFKEAIYEDPFLVLSSWNSLDPDPCQWSNVFCSSARDHVIKLNISSSSLKGFLVPELGFLTYLEQLILHGNNLIGTIPKEVGMLQNLKVLDLGKNQLTGPIPPELGNMKNLVKINLHSNVLTGTIPPELANLKKLQELRLDKNKLQGIVLDNNGTNFSSNINGMFASSGNTVNFCHSSELRVADFSYNFFIGSIPKCLSFLPRSSFQENCLEEKNVKQRPGSQCGIGAAPLPQTNSHTAGSSSKSKPLDDNAKHQANSKPTWILGMEIVTGVMVGILIFVAIFTIFRRWNSKESMMMMMIPWRKSSNAKGGFTVYIDPNMLKDVPRYSRRELEVACEDFSNIIGSSSNSVVYKGTVKGGPEIAAISFFIKEEQWSGYHELYFQREVADLARLNHDNTGKLLGYCRDSSPFTRMLVIEYASNGTLSEHLHFGDGPDGCQLSWARRMKIIIGIARGLKYLHSELDPPFTISELNSTSVYLTEDFSPKLVDFESWKTILARSEKNSKSIESDGAICVLPNSIEERHLDMKGNVYAFGLLLLEIISGRPLCSKDRGSLLDWARDYIEVSEAMCNLVDPELKHFEQEDLRAICELASICIKVDPTSRLSMSEVCTTLESRIDLSISAELRSSSLAWAELALDL